MTDTAIAVVRRVAEGWRSEAAKRTRISQHDPVADAITYCADELEDAVRTLDAPGAMRTVDQYAIDHGVSAQTVRKWIGVGRLDADRTPHGFRIRREAAVRPPRRVGTQ